MKRRHVVQTIGGVAVAGATIAATAGNAWGAAEEDSGVADALVFDPEAYEELTKTVTTGDGEKTVVYRFYGNIVYVAYPVDEAYQSLNVSVPVEIDGTAVDASKAPIVLANSIGGYMSSSTAANTEVGGGGSMGGGLPGGATGEDGVESGSGAQVGAGGMVSNADYAIASGYVVVEPGARGRDLVDDSGEYCGVAPAAIVDLKAAVRYLRHNRDLIPGDTDRIVSTGSSAGGALSTLLGASGDSGLYDAYLDEIGAADASDAIFAAAGYCPITDLEHADMSYEWAFGSLPLQDGSTVDDEVSETLAAAFTRYQKRLNLNGGKGFKKLTADNYGEYLTKTHLIPAAATYLAALSDTDRDAYLAEQAWITWDGESASFTWEDFLAYLGTRSKGAPAFDAFDLSAGENNLFGTGTTAARHFTTYSLRYASGDDSARLDEDLPELLRLTNPMHFIGERHRGRARNWWFRVGAKDTDTSLSIVGNLALSLDGLGDEVDAAMYWDAGHGANEDPAEFMTWIAEVTGYSR